MLKGILGLMTFAVLVARCREKKAPASDEMVGMTMQADCLMPMMRAQLESLDMGSSMNAAMLARHEELASRMLDAMGSDMRMMGMPGDSAWTALADSVRQDLAVLPTLSGRVLETRMRAHDMRMRRLIDMHAGMMHK